MIWRRTTSYLLVGLLAVGLGTARALHEAEESISWFLPACAPAAADGGPRTPVSHPCQSDGHRGDDCNICHQFVMGSTAVVSGAAPPVTVASPRAGCAIQIEAAPHAADLPLPLSARAPPL